MQCTVCPVSPIICKHPVTTRGSQRCESKRRFIALLHSGLPQGTSVHFSPSRLLRCPQQTSHFRREQQQLSGQTSAKQHGRLQRVLTTHKCLFSGPFFFFFSLRVLVSWRLNGHLISVSKKVKANKSVAVAR